jgi:hypothetical protein
MNFSADLAVAAAVALVLPVKAATAVLAVEVSISRFWALRH